MIKEYTGMFLYEVIGKHLPTSFSRIQIGQKKFRAFCTKLFVKKVGKNINVEKGAMFSRFISIDDNSGIGIDAKIYGEVEIGKNVMMGPDCVIYTRNHAYMSNDIPMNQQGFAEPKKVTICDDVWLCGQVIILPGVTIGDHSIVGAGAVVTKDVPEWSVVGGNPAVVLKYRK